MPSMDGVGNYGMFKGANELVPNTGTFITKKIGFYRKGAFVLARKTPIWAEEDLEFHHEMSDLYWEKDGFTGFHLGRYSISPKKPILNLVASTWIPWIPLSRPQVMQTIDLAGLLPDGSETGEGAGAIAVATGTNRAWYRGPVGPVDPVSGAHWSPIFR